MESLLVLGALVWTLWYLWSKNNDRSPDAPPVSGDNRKPQHNKPQGRTAATNAGVQLHAGSDGPLPPSARKTCPTGSVTKTPNVVTPSSPVTTQIPISAPALEKRNQELFPFCALDTETTGIVPKSRRHRAFEISCVKFTPTGEGKKYRKERFTRYIKVDVGTMKGLKLSPMWQDHSSSGGQKNAISAATALGELRDFIQDAPLVCHNAPFDKCVIENEIEKTAYRWRPTNKWICTLRMARSGQLGVFVGYSPGRKDGMSYKLEHVASSLNLSFDPNQLHLGHYDAEVAGTVFLKLHYIRTIPVWHL